MGNLQITATALSDQGGFDQLQGVSGNTLIANNDAMLSFNFFDLKYMGSGVTLFQNPALTSFEAAHLLAIASDSGTDISTGLQVFPLTSSALWTEGNPHAAQQKLSQRSFWHHFYAMVWQFKAKCCEFSALAPVMCSAFPGGECDAA